MVKQEEHGRCSLIKMIIEQTSLLESLLLISSLYENW